MNTSIREALNEVKAVYEAADSASLVKYLEAMGVEASKMHRFEMIDLLMAFEEHAAFH